MLTFEDCVRFGDLEEDAVAAIAEHEHVPEMVACELGQNLVRTNEGTSQIRRFIEEELAIARHHHDQYRVDHLTRTLAHFDENHPIH